VAGATASAKLGATFVAERLARVGPAQGANFNGGLLFCASACAAHVKA
jgi:hypothetical protein